MFRRRDTRCSVDDEGIETRQVLSVRKESVYLNISFYIGVDGEIQRGEEYDTLLSEVSSP